MLYCPAADETYPNGNQFLPPHTMSTGSKATFDQLQARTAVVLTFTTNNTAIAFDTTNILQH